jgi:selenocysteine lyase/cysteine desulfurase
MTKSDVLYMNNASLGMPPASVVDAVAGGYEMLSENPLHGKHTLTDKVNNVVLPALADFVGAQPQELILTRNASEALHLVAVSLQLERGDEVLITTQEHPAGRKPWRYRMARHGIQVTEVFIPSPLVSEEDVVSRIAARITPRTKALAFCHVTRGGHLYPVKRLAGLARERGLMSIVDGAQAIGMLKVDLRDLGCDAYAASLHKWILAPMGTGMLYIRGDRHGKFRSAFDEESAPEVPNYAPIGTADLPPRAAIGDALLFLEEIGIEAIEQRNRFLSDTLKARLKERKNVTILSGATPELSAPGSTIFEMKGVDPFREVARLEEKGIFIDEHVRDGHQALRISTHCYNSLEEIDRVVKELGKG